MPSILFDTKATFEPLSRNPFRHIGRVAPEVNPNNMVAATIIIRLLEKYIISDSSRHIFMILTAYSFFNLPAMKFEDIFPKKV